MLEMIFQTTLGRIFLVTSFRGTSNLFTKVLSAMLFQSRNGPERFPAETLVRSIIAVDHHMVCETFSVGILLVANSTLESSGSCVDNHVCLQITLMTKCLPTFRTLILLYFCMDNHVRFQMSLLTKCLPTFGTLIVLFLCMDNHVRFQMSLLTKCLPIFRTLIVLQNYSMCGASYHWLPLSMRLEILSGESRNIYVYGGRETFVVEQALKSVGGTNGAPFWKPPIGLQEEIW